MADFPFISKFGKITYSNPAEAFVRHHTYIVLKSNNEIICIYRRADELYALPTPEDLQIKGALSGEFTTLSYLTENNHQIKEEQTYLIYNVKKDELPDASFQWCRIEDILLNKIAFDLTQLVGVKNLIVRSKE